jgi:large subunit ribosomal protein L10
MQVAKNTLIKKALEAASGEYAELYDVLKGSSTLLFSNSANAPAKLIKALRASGDKPLLKAAYIDSAIFIGDNQLNALVNLKSKEELIGDIIGLLQSPAKNVISGLQSGKSKLAGIVKALEQRG